MKKILFPVMILIAFVGCSKDDDPLSGKTTSVEAYEPYVSPGSILETITAKDGFKWYVYANGEEVTVSTGIKNKNGSAKVTWAVYYKNVTKSPEYIKIDTGQLPLNYINQSIYSKYTFPKTQTGVYRLHYFVYYNGKKEETMSSLFFLYDKDTYKKGQWGRDVP